MTERVEEKRPAALATTAQKKQQLSMSQTVRYDRRPLAKPRQALAIPPPKPVRGWRARVRTLERARHRTCRTMTAASSISSSTTLKGAATTMMERAFPIGHDDHHVQSGGVAEQRKRATRAAEDETNLSFMHVAPPTSRIQFPRSHFAALTETPTYAGVISPRETPLFRFRTAVNATNADERLATVAAVATGAPVNALTTRSSDVHALPTRDWSVSGVTSFRSRRFDNERVKTPARVSSPGGRATDRRAQSVLPPVNIIPGMSQRAAEQLSRRIRAKTPRSNTSLSTIAKQSHLQHASVFGSTHDSARVHNLKESFGFDGASKRPSRGPATTMRGSSGSSAAKVDHEVFAKLFINRPHRVFAPDYMKSPARVDLRIVSGVSADGGGGSTAHAGTSGRGVGTEPLTNDARVEVPGATRDERRYFLERQRCLLQIQDFRMLALGCKRSGRQRAEANSYYSMGVLYDNIGAFSKAIIMYNRFRGALERAARRTGQLEHDRFSLCLAHNSLGVAHQCIAATQHGSVAEKARPQPLEGEASSREVCQRGGSGVAVVDSEGEKDQCGANENAVEATMPSSVALLRALYHHQKHAELADVPGQFIAYTNLGLVYQALGQSRHAHVHHQHALRCAIRMSSIAGQSIAVGNIGLNGYASDDFLTAEACLLRHAELADSIGDSRSSAYALYTLGSVAQKQGDTEKSDSYFRSAMKCMVRLGDSAQANELRVRLGVARGVSAYAQHMEKLSARLHKQMEQERCMDDAKRTASSDALYSSVL